MKHPSAGPPADFDDEDERALQTLGLQRTDVGRRAGCPSLEEIQAAASETLPEPARLAVERHIATCAVCAMLAADLRDWDGAELTVEADRRIRNALTASARSSSRWRAPAWGFAAAAALAATAFLPSLMREGRVEPGPRPPSSAPAGPVLVLEPLAVRSGPGLAVRGGDGFEEALAAALAPYTAGDHDQAVVRLSAVGERYPDAASPRLYLGVALLLAGRAEEAVVALEAARSHAGAFWGPHAAWYLAIARERTGRLDAARAQLDELCRGGSEYSARACAAATSLPSPAPR